jgi:hypothetical protein
LCTYIHSRHRCPHRPESDRPPFDLQPDAGLSGVTSLSHAAYHAYTSEEVQRPKLHRLHTALELPDGQLDTVTAYRADYDEKHAERQAR